MTAQQVHQAYDDVVNEHQAAKILGLAVQTIRNYRCSRNPDAPAYYKLGRSVRYRVGDLLDYLEKHRIDPKAV
jgi:predicted DNA-binding transcriptional regulator AlpA